jgi:hypothetical protein
MRLRQALGSRYRNYVVREGGDWTVAVAYEPGLDETVTTISHQETRTEFQVAAHRGWMDFTRRLASVTTPSDEAAASAVERVVSYILMQELPRYHEAILLHAAAIVIDGEGYVFFGASGRGKSTVARLAAGVGQVLTDETAIVQLTSQGPEIVVTPFWGLGTTEHWIHQVRHRRVPLKAVYSLAHGVEFRWTRLSPARAVMAMLTSEKVATERSQSARAWLDVAARFVEQVPVYQLHFLPHRGLWPFLKLGLNGENRDQS